MNFVVLGSGGCTVTPRPGCFCSICEEARQKGIPYTRTGPSLFLEDIHAVFDTPEDILGQLTRENIHRIDSIFYTHWHPDHTMGMRIVEQMYMNYLGWFIERKGVTKEVRVYSLPDTMRDLKAISNKYGSYLEYYERYGLISLVTLEEETPLEIEDYRIIPIPVETPGLTSTVFVISHEEKKVAYAPCDIKPFPEHDILKDLDVLIIGGILPEGELKGGYIIPEDNELRKETFTIEELLEIIDTLRVKRTIAVHIEEDFGRSYDDYRKIENQYDRAIEFAYDGMKIVV
jgi:phosphoribosyl 1,2-cyclic phosphate phosphodiesterase